MKKNKLFLIMLATAVTVISTAFIMQTKITVKGSFLSFRNFKMFKKLIWQI